MSKDTAATELGFVNEEAMALWDKVREKQSAAKVEWLMGELCNLIVLNRNLQTRVAALEDQVVQYNSR